MTCVRAHKFHCTRTRTQPAYDGGMSEPAPAAARSGPDASVASPGRAPWGSLSREDIVDAAAAIVEAGGYEEMSIRSLAADLGVAPMSLYRHIRDKDDLLDEVVSRLLAPVWRPAASEDNWQEWITEAAASLRQFLVSQPAALRVYLRHPVVSPAAVERMDAMIGVLRRAGLDEPAARAAYGALHTYTIGFAALEASRAGWVPDGGDVTSLARQLAAYTTAGQFIEGLRYLLEGISRHLRPA
jgi:TetR/AcrR family transcriptional regulator, tetracycline repressor protein